MVFFVYGQVEPTNKNFRSVADLVSNSLCRHSVAAVIVFGLGALLLLFFLWFSQRVSSHLWEICYLTHKLAFNGTATLKHWVWYKLNKINNSEAPDQNQSELLLLKQCATVVKRGENSMNKTVPKSLAKHKYSTVNQSKLEVITPPLCHPHEIMKRTRRNYL